MSFINTVRKIERIRYYVTLFLVGAFFIAASCVALSLPKGELISADVTISRIEFYTDSSGEEQTDVFVSYTDEKGVSHEDVRYPSYSSSMEEGKTVTVLYDPASPEDVRAPGAEYIPYAFLVIGVIAIVVSVLKILSGKKKAGSNAPFTDEKQPVDPILIEQIKNNDESVRDYYFHWTGKLNQSYILETHEREAVYEAICDHIGFFTPYRYTFVNRNTAAEQEHKVSHTMTTRYGSDRLSLVSSSHFKIDGVDNWEYLAKLGYSIEPKRCGIKLNFDVLHHGVPVAYLEAAGTNILKDGANSFLGDKLSAAGLFKVSCKDSDLEGVFMACFCASRVEFY